MKTKPLFSLSCIAVIAVAAWLGFASLPVHGDAPTAKNPSDQLGELKVVNEKLDRILKILESQPTSGNAPHVMVEVPLPPDIQNIFKSHVHRDKEKVVAGQLERDDFTQGEQAKLDAFLREKLGRKDATFSWGVTSSCGKCINTGQDGYYNIWIPIQGDGGVYACGGC